MSQELRSLRLRYAELVQKLGVWQELYPDDEAEIELLQKLIALLVPRIRAAGRRDPTDPLEQLSRLDSLTDHPGRYGAEDPGPDSR